jgi:prevent-host-death family protein
MKLSLQEDVESLSHFKANFTSILKKSRDTGRPTVITQNGRATGVFMDVATWENSVRKVNLLRLVAEGEISLKTEKPLSLDDVQTHIKRKFGI